MKIRVATSGFIFNDKNEILLAERVQGFWSNLGGGLEDGETPEDALVRELKEEIGIKVLNCAIIYATRITANEGMIMLFYVVTSYTGTPENLEPQSHKQIAWFDLENLPQPLSEGLTSIVEDNAAAFKTLREVISL